MKNNEAGKKQKAQDLQSEWRHSAVVQGQRELMALHIILKLPTLLSSH